MGEFHKPSVVSLASLLFGLNFNRFYYLLKTKVL
jgi:hypothetical protein